MRARSDHSLILIEDPELGRGLTGDRLKMAQRDCVAAVMRVRAGGWDTGQLPSRIRSGLGLLVLDGLLARRVGVEGRFGAELLGAGDLLRPWQREDAPATLPFTGSWRVLSNSRMAILDSALALRLTRYPELTAALLGRAIARSRHLALNLAIMHQPRVDVRLHMLFWLLADRWGAVSSDGVRLPIRVTHAVLGELIGARRPSVTKALGELSDSAAVRWEGSAWLLRGGPPAELHEVAVTPSRAAGGAGARAAGREPRRGTVAPLRSLPC